MSKKIDLFPANFADETNSDLISLVNANVFGETASGESPSAGSADPVEFSYEKILTATGGAITFPTVRIVGPEGGAAPEEGTFESFESVLQYDPDFSGNVVVQIEGGTTTTAFPTSEETLTFTGYFFGGPEITASGEADEYHSAVVVFDDYLPESASSYNLISGGTRVELSVGERASVTGSSSVTIDRTNFETHKIVCGGCVVFGGTVNSYADTSVSIASGTFHSVVVGGGAVGGKKDDSDLATLCCVGNTSSLDISGGVFMNAVAAGSYNQNGKTIGLQSPHYILHISGGDFQRMVCGGNIANTKASAKKAKDETSPIDISGGNVEISITVDTSERDVTFRNGLIAGSYGGGLVVGTTSVTFSGFSDYLRFDPEGSYNYVVGDSADAGDGEYRRTTGLRQLTFSNWRPTDENLSGDFAPGNLCGFDSVSLLNGSRVTFGSGENGTGFDLSTVRYWNLDATSTLTWKTGKNDLIGDVMDIALNGNDLSTPWTLIDGTSQTLYGWMYMTNLGSVTIDGQIASFDYANYVYKTADYQLSYTSDRETKSAKLVVSKINA